MNGGNKLYIHTTPWISIVVNVSSNDNLLITCENKDQLLRIVIDPKHRFQDHLNNRC